ncbi:hypothetical protein D3P07_09000 [Paenibacillus sp. 1011MAR3C5]|uniref:hypothetical protein n=1 Tax=Paenibacillus sp. 1011MAR3C5 TaxID=1675787 RepID=UPI000E6D2F4E|nr:hypothetical protein [Paenibacillus sp. 1011MAR3C5]RJE90327.1 hypothetical protein D3P07_09000 [Paenibacillus sp. 1011MAR3C5]
MEDVTDATAFEMFIRDVYEKFGRLEYLFKNAGCPIPTHFLLFPAAHRKLMRLVAKSCVIVRVIC